MQISNTIKLQSNIISEKIDFPNLSFEKNLIPDSIRILTNNSNNEKEYAQDIIVKVYINGTEVNEYYESYFKLIKNYICLNEYKTILNSGSNLQLFIKTFSNEPKIYNIIVNYVKNYGSIIYQSINEKAENILKNIDYKGYCTKMILSFSDKISKVKFISLIDLINNDLEERVNSNIDNEWFYSFDVEESEDNKYVIDFTNDNKIYIKYLKFMRLIIEENENKQFDKEDVIKIFCVAYGYKK